MGLELADLLRKFKWKRELDLKGVSSRKMLALLFVATALFLYFGPSFFRWLLGSVAPPRGPCLNDRLDAYLDEALNGDAHIRYQPPHVGSTLDVIHLVANGRVGVDTSAAESPLFVKTGRVVSLAVPFRPLVSVETEMVKGSTTVEEVSVLQMARGLVHRLRCTGDLQVTQEIFAHQVTESLLVQSVQIVNSGGRDASLRLVRPGLGDWKSAVVRTTKVRGADGSDQDHLLVTGTVRDGARDVAVALVTTKVSADVKVKAGDSATFQVLTSTAYAVLRKTDQYAVVREALEKEALKEVSSALAAPLWRLRDDHVDVWRQLFRSGLSISPSKAVGAINGDRINATLYLTLSQVRSRGLTPPQQSKLSAAERENLNLHLAYTEGCYGAYPTLKAAKLWSDLSTMEAVVRVTSLWLRTLETQGCAKLVATGTEGVMQAMLLSMGAFKFSHQHLEFNTEAGDLHREFHWRRLGYGNATHVNVTVALREDNRAVLYAALDRSDGDYYACDGGCLDPPVALGPRRTAFPVKRTEPRTALLYVTSDKQHMEDLKHTIHVHEVEEAPAHEHHVIALHRHGNHLGGLPTAFWAIFSLLIILFHLFLFKLIYNEYCAGVQPEIGRSHSRFRKFSDL